jgi:hypothetical protein
MEYDNTNRGTLFGNDRKEEDRHPDMTGTLNVNGVEYKISAWKRTSKAGAKFLSLSVREKTDMGTAPSRPAAQPKYVKDDVETDIPF